MCVRIYTVLTLKSDCRAWAYRCHLHVLQSFDKIWLPRHFKKMLTKTGGHSTTNGQAYPYAMIVP